MILANSRLSYITTWKVKLFKVIAFSVACLRLNAFMLKFRSSLKMGFGFRRSLTLSLPLWKSYMKMVKYGKWLIFSCKWKFRCILESFAELLIAFTSSVLFSRSIWDSLSKFIPSAHTFHSDIYLHRFHILQIPLKCPFLWTFIASLRLYYLRHISHSKGFYPVCNR